MAAMALNNTTDRYNYIYGNNARKLDRFTDYYGGTSPRKEEPLPQPSRKKKQKKYVKTREAFDWRFTFMATLAIIFIFTAALFYVKETSEVNNMAQTIKELKDQKQNLQSRQVAIRSELDKAVNLDEIREYAEDKLDMVCPEHDNIIYYYQDSSDYFRQFESVN